MNILWRVFTLKEWLHRPKKIDVWHQTLSRSLHRGCGLGMRLIPIMVVFLTLLWPVWLNKMQNLHINFHAKLLLKIADWRGYHCVIMWGIVNTCHASELWMIFVTLHACCLCWANIYLFPQLWGSVTQPHVIQNITMLNLSSDNCKQWTG